MIYTAIDTFYLTDEQLQDSPSRKDGIDEHTEMMLRIYGCDLIQESGILLRLPQAVMATGQVLFHRFYCKKSFTRFSVKRVAASCVWLASKLEESPRRAKQVILVFHRMESRRENLPVEHLDLFSKKYQELKNDLVRTERHLLKEMGFICHVEHPHKFISNYLDILETPPDLAQKAWNLANDSLRTRLCVRFKSEVIACGVIYAAARRSQIPLPENPPWWLVFDADQNGIDEVCRVLAHLYTLPKAQYIPVYKDKNDSFTSFNKTPEAQAQISKENLANSTAENEDNLNTDGKVEEIKNNEERSREKERERSRGKDRDARGRDSDSERDRRGRESDKKREKEFDREREKHKERSHRSKEKGSGHLDKSRHYSSADRSDYYSSSHSSRDKERHRHYS